MRRMCSSPSLKALLASNTCCIPSMSSPVMVVLNCCALCSMRIKVSGCCLRGQLPERAEVVLAVHGRYDDLRLSGSGQLRIHHDPCEPAVPVQKGVHLTDHEHHVCGLGKWVFQCPVKLKTPHERTLHERVVNKFGITGPVVPVLELTGVLGRPGNHQCTVAITEYPEQLPGIFRCDGHFLPVADNLVGTEYVVGILVPCGQRLSGLDNT